MADESVFDEGGQPSPFLLLLKNESEAWGKRWPEASKGHHSLDADLDAIRGQLRVFGDEIARLRVIAMDDNQIRTAQEGFGELLHGSAHMFAIGASSGLLHLLESHMESLGGGRREPDERE